MSELTMRQQLQELADELAESRAENELETPGDEPIQSPCRKKATGNVRNLKAMGETKFLDVREAMAAFKEIDPEGFKAVEAEAERRGLS